MASTPSPRRVGRKAQSLGRDLLQKFWSFLRTLLLLLLWILAGLLLYGLVYGITGWFAGYPLRILQIIERTYRALAGEGGRETTTVLLAFLSGLLGFGVQQWRSTVEEERERRERRQKALEELEALSTALRKKRYREALSLHRAFSQKCQKVWKDPELEEALRSRWEEAAPRPLVKWVTLDERRKPPNIPLERDTLEALVWAWRLDRERREQVLELIKETITPKRLPDLRSVLEQKENRHLLYSEIVHLRLKELEDQEVPEPDREHLKVLQGWRSIPASLPSPWEGLTRPADPPKINERLREWGFARNPFGPEWAELEPMLAKYGVWPAALKGMSGLRPALVLGPSGSGRTAAAHLLWHRCLNPPGKPDEPDIFPVYLKAAAWSEDPAGWADLIGREVAEALLRFCAKEPYSLFESLDGSAVAQLMACYLGPSPHLEVHLRRAGVPEGTREYILGEVEERTAGDWKPDFVALMDLLGRARPPRLQATYVIVDALPSLPPPLPSLMSLLDLALALAPCNVFLKMFLPDSLRSEVRPTCPLEPLSLAWSEEDLREMLRQRLEWASDGAVNSLRRIFSETDYPPDPDTWLIQEARGLPRQLVRLGNRMLAGH